MKQRHLSVNTERCRCFVTFYIFPEYFGCVFLFLQEIPQYTATTSCKDCQYLHLTALCRNTLHFLKHFLKVLDAESHNNLIDSIERPLMCNRFQKQYRNKYSRSYPVEFSAALVCEYHFATTGYRTYISSFHPFDQKNFASSTSDSHCQISSHCNFS